VLVTWFVADRAGLGLAEIRTLDLTGWAFAWPTLVGSCALLLSGFFFGGWLWGDIVAGLGGPPLPTADRIRLYMIANLGRYVPGKVWQVGVLAVLGRRRGVPSPVAAASAVVLQGVALASALIVGLGSLWTLAEGAWWGRLAVGAVLGATVVALTPPVFRSVTALWFRVTRTQDPPALEPGDAAVWLALGVMNWVVYASAFWVFVIGLGFDVAWLDTSSAFAAAYVLGYLAIFAPAGVGVREASLLALLSPQLGAAAAGAVAVLARLWSTGVEVVFAGAFWAREVAHPVGTEPSAEPEPAATPDRPGAEVERHV
jgi:uncharacterized membrane protein YbhN (UPF0104 family)